MQNVQRNHQQLEQLGLHYREIPQKQYNKQRQSKERMQQKYIQQVQIQAKKDLMKQKMMKNLVLVCLVLMELVMFTYLFNLLGSMEHPVWNEAAAWNRKITALVQSAIFTSLINAIIANVSSKFSIGEDVDHDDLDEDDPDQRDAI